MSITHTAKIAVLALVVIVTQPTNSDAKAGDLDPTFGMNGVVVTHTCPGTSQSGGGGEAVFIQADGKILVPAYCGAPPPSTPLARYHPNGFLDESFGNSGIVTLGVYPDFYLWLPGIAVQPDGKVLIPGAVTTGGNTDFLVVRLNDDGTPDATFGAGGTAVVDISEIDEAYDLTARADGSIVVVGSTFANMSPSDFAVFVLDQNGVLDGSFGVGGIVTTDFGNSAYDSAEPRAVIGLSDGSIAVAGNIDSQRIAIARYLPAGNLDPAFGIGGVVDSDVTAGSDSAIGMVRQDDGKLLVLNGTNPAVVRYEADGDLDVTFGTGGVVPLVSAVEIQLPSIAIGPAGKIFVAGFAPADETRGVVVALEPDGSRAPDFGIDGELVIHSDGQDDWLTAAAVQADGKLVVAGTSLDPLQGDEVLLLRFEPMKCRDGNIDPSEQCDDGGESTTCDVDCTAVACGDSTINVSAQEECDDGNTSNGDGCSATCLVETPCDGLTACRQLGPSGKSQVQISATPDPLREKLTWAWGRGETTNVQDFAVPTDNTAYWICVEDSGNSVLQLSVPPDPVRWRRKQNGFQYRDRDGIVTGVRSISLRTGASGEASLRVKSKGPLIDLPTPFAPLQYFQQSPAVSVRLINSDGECWQADYLATDTAKNDGERFKAKTP